MDRVSRLSPTPQPREPRLVAAEVEVPSWRANTKPSAVQPDYAGASAGAAIQSGQHLVLQPAEHLE